MADDRFVLTDAQAQELAATYGTPLYVIDEANFRARLQRYRAAFQAVWPEISLSYASKANSILAILKIAYEERYDIDVASEGEFRAALLAGVPAADCHLHGNAKSFEEIKFGLDEGIEQIIVDNFAELEALGVFMSEAHRARTSLLLRLAPGVDPKTHQAISTGQADTKFGFNIGDGSAMRAVKRCLDLGLPLKGYHCHVGSQLLDPDAQRAGGAQIARFAVAVHEELGYAPKYLNLGGGLGVEYVRDHHPMPIEDYCRLVVDAVRSELGDLRLVLTQEPGRSVIAEAGVTLYQVCVRKTVPAPSGPKTYLAVDGGLSDNPRSVMYDAQYEVRPIAVTGEPQLFTISGKHCETDRLFDQVSLPGDIKEGDLVQVLCTGAYNASMASNYNRFLRPACVLLRANGAAEVIQKRETWDQLFSREETP